MYLSPHIIYAIAGGTGLLLLILIIWLIRLQMRLNKLFVGKNATSFEDSFNVLTKDVKDLQHFTHEMETYLTTVERRVKKSIQGIGTVRYNPFKGTGSGGNNSFSTAILNQDGTGIVLTSMYARDRISMFAKPVTNFTSEYELSEEEVESITICKQKIITP